VGDLDQVINLHDNQRPSPTPSLPGREWRESGLELCFSCCWRSSAKTTPVRRPGDCSSWRSPRSDSRLWRARLRPALKLLIGPLVVTGRLRGPAFTPPCAGNLLQAYYNKTVLFNAALTVLALWPESDQCVLSALAFGVASPTL